jgi:hypothetical protein
MLPRVTIHNAVSANGRIDWFEAYVGILCDLAGRWHGDCALVGSGTNLASPDGAVPLAFVSAETMGDGERKPQ